MSDIPSRRQLDLAVNFSFRVFEFILDLEGYTFNMNQSMRFRMARMRLSFQEPSDMPPEQFVEDFSTLTLHYVQEMRDTHETLRSQYLENIFSGPPSFVQYIKDYVATNFFGDRLTNDFFFYFVFSVDLIVVCNELGCRNLIPYALWEVEETLKTVLDMYDVPVFHINEICSQIINEFLV